MPRTSCLLARNTSIGKAKPFASRPSTGSSASGGRRLSSTHDTVHRTACPIWMAAEKIRHQSRLRPGRPRIIACTKGRGAGKGGPWPAASRQRRSRKDSGLFPRYLVKRREHVKIANGVCTGSVKCSRHQNQSYGQILPPSVRANHTRGQMRPRCQKRCGQNEGIPST